MQFSPIVVLAIIGFSLAAPQDPLQARGVISAAGQCGSLRRCDDSDCLGISDPFEHGTGKGTCKNGFLEGCPCLSTCGRNPKPCNQNGCQGKSLANGGLGTCFDGAFNGCSCKSVCGKVTGGCTENGCEGKDNVCQSGGAKGCLCK